jgi:tol-pal system protein YbgF
MARIDATMDVMKRLSFRGLRLALTLPAFMLPAFVLLASPASAQRDSSVYIEDRMNQLQQTVTSLTGQLEQLQNQNHQLKQQLDKMQADYDFRIDQLEKGKGGTGSRPSVPPASAPPASVPPAAVPPGRSPTASAPPTASGAPGEQLYHDAFKLLQDGDYAAAARAFKSFVQSNPKHPLAGSAQYWLGETYYARRDYQQAMVAFAEGYKTYKTSPKGPDNLLKLGITLAAMNKKRDACAVFQRFNQDYPRATDLQKRRIDQERQRNSCG